MSSTSTVTFRSTDLGEDVSLMLCFTPPSSNAYEEEFPVAWKVTTLSATGRSFLRVTWSNTLAVSTAQVGSGQRVIAGNYIPIGYGQSSNLMSDESKNPPVYHWTEPISLGPGSDYVQGNNKTTRAVDLSLGFITDIDTDLEDMSTVLFYPKVAPNMSMRAKFTPVLSAYVKTTYQENQIVTRDIQQAQCVWAGNLNDLQTDLTVVIKKDKDGEFVGEAVQAARADDVAEGGLPLSLSQSAVLDTGRTYRATVSFLNADTIPRSIQAMTKALISQGYRVKVTFDGMNTDANLELALPPNKTYEQAERDATDSLVGPSMVYPPPVSVRTRGGALAFESEVEGAWSFWRNVSPASQDWYTAAKGDDDEKHKAIEDALEVVTKMLDKVNGV